MTYTITFTLPTYESTDVDKVVLDKIIESIDDVTHGQANIIECKEVQP